MAFYIYRVSGVFTFLHIHTKLRWQYDRSSLHIFFAVLNLSFILQDNIERWGGNVAVLNKGFYLEVCALDGEGMPIL